MIIFDPFAVSESTHCTVPIYTKNIPSASVVHFRIGFNVGLIDDPENAVGLSHLLEHMFFDGSKKFPSKFAIKSFSKEKLLGSGNAWTSTYATVFNGYYLPSDRESVYDGLIDFLTQPLLSEESLAEEKKVILEEAWGRYLNQQYLEYQKTDRELFYTPTHPLSKRISALGFPGSIDNVTTDDLHNWFTQNYHRGSCFIVLTGAVNEKDIDCAKKFIEALPEGTRKLPSHHPITPSTPQVTEKTYSSKDIGSPQEQATITLKKIIPVPATDELDAIQEVSARLLRDVINEKLREELSLCYGVHVSLSGNDFNSLLHISLDLSTTSVERTREELRKIQASFTDSTHQARFDVEKRALLKRIEAVERLSGDVADICADQLIEYGNIISVSRRLELLKNVTFEDVRVYLANTLSDEGLYTRTILP
jgi:predicted Zn-dependent peptidase